MNDSRYVVSQLISLPIDELKRLVRQLVGFRRVGSVLDVVTARAIQLLIADGVLTEKDGAVSMTSGLTD